MQEKKLNGLFFLLFLSFICQKLSDDYDEDDDDDDDDKMMIMKIIITVFSEMLSMIFLQTITFRYLV